MKTIYKAEDGHASPEVTGVELDGVHDKASLARALVQVVREHNQPKKNGSLDKIEGQRRLNALAMLDDVLATLIDNPFSETPTELHVESDLHASSVVQRHARPSLLLAEAVQLFGAEPIQSLAA